MRYYTSASVGHCNGSGSGGVGGGGGRGGGGGGGGRGGGSTYPELYTAVAVLVKHKVCLDSVINRKFSGTLF